MKKLITVLLLFLTSVVWGQTSNFDDDSKWTAGSGTINSYQTDHQYNDVIGGFNVNYTGGPALRESSGTQDGFDKTHNGSPYSWRLRNKSTVEWFATIEATSIDGFSFYVRRWDSSPATNFDVAYSIDGGNSYTSIGTINNSLLSDSDWKQFTYSSNITSNTTNIKIRIKANGTTERIMIDDFSFDNPLPVELTTFSAIMKGNAVELKWQTATEVNNYGFEIQRSAEEQGTWEKIGFVKGHGNSNSPKHYSFTDTDVEQAGNYFYRLKQIDVDGSFEFSPVVEVYFGAPDKFELAQNYPNPFNPATTISYTIPEAQQVQLTVYNVLGKEIATLVNKQQPAGNYKVFFDGSDLPSGIYIYKLQAGNFVQTRKMMLVK